MTARFLALYEPPADPETFERHYRQIHVPLLRHLPGLRRYTGPSLLRHRISSTQTMRLNQCGTVRCRVNRPRPCLALTPAFTAPSR